MKIAILLNAGKDSIGRERKLTMLLDQQGQVHDVLPEWPEPHDQSVHWGPILVITPEEYIFYLQVAQGVGL